MEENKRFILKNKKISVIMLIVSLILFGVALAATIILNIKDIRSYWYLIIITTLLWIAVVLSFIFTILIRCVELKEYSYEGLRIGIYAGFSHHNLYVNDRLVDEYETWLTINPIKLNYNYMGYELEATISQSNKAKLKVNGELLQPKIKY